MNLFFRNKKYKYFLSSNIFNAIGITLFDIVFIVYAKSFPNPELAISAVTFISTVPYIGDFVIGYISDKSTNKFNKIMVTRIFQAFFYVAFAVLADFSHSWLIFGIVLLINFCSDLAGAYTEYLSLPIIKHIVVEKDLTEARSFQSGILNAINLVGELFGVALITALHYNYSLFGVLNATFFIFSFLILWIHKDIFKFLISRKEEAKEEGKSNIFSYLKNFIYDSVENLKLLTKLRSLFHFTLLFSLMNLISSAQFSLLPLTFVNQESLQFGTFGFTVAIVNTAETVGVILGALFPFYFRKKSIELNLVLEILLTIGVILSIILIGDKYVLLAFTFLTGYMLGLANPRIDAFIMITSPEDKISSVTSIFYTLVQLTLPIGSAAFLFIANTISIKTSWISLLIVTLLTLSFSVMMNIKNSTIPEKHSKSE